MNREQVRQNTLNLFAGATYLRGETTIQSIVLKANKAYITTKERDVVVLTNAQTRQTNTLIDNESDAVVWRKVGREWKEEAVRVISEKDVVRPGTHLDATP